MYLTKIGKDINKSSTHVEFEKVADDLLMISVNNNTDDQSKVFSYWRVLGNGGNPPLEVGINTDTKAIKSITLFVDADCFEKFQLLCENTSQGNALVDTSVFSKKNDYVDTSGNYFVSLADKKFICKFNEQCSIKEAIVNGSIEFYVDNNDHLKGFAVDNLTEAEVRAIKSLL